MSARQAIGKYEILEQIGAGGFAAVYKARDPFIKRLVAIKLCAAGDAQLRRRFFREAEISGNLHHPSIVTVFDFGLEQEAPYLVQEYLKGDDLDNLIRRREPIPEPERLECLMQVARGLRYAHGKGVLHRDVKPGNVRFLGGGRAKLMDFGIATLKSAHTRLTRTGTLVGTAGYLAPEQLHGQELDERVDIFSFGVLAYELLTFNRPFEGDSLEESCRNILESEPPPLSTRVDGYPAEMDELASRCLAKDPDDRYRSFDELLPQLNRVLVRVRPERRRGPRPAAEAGGEGAASPAPAVEAAPRAGRRGARWLAAAAAGLLALTLGLLAWSLGSRQSRAPVAAAGLLAVEATPWARVVSIRDAAGEQLPLPPDAETPIALRLPAGAYTLELAHPEAGAGSCSAQLAAGGSSRCLVRFAELGARDYFKQVGWWR